MARVVEPKEALRLMNDEGYAYVDVRSVPEFEQGHPEHAYNVPLAHVGAMGMQANPDFLAVMTAAFARDAKLVVGCKANGRSSQAIALLEAQGFTNLVLQNAGWAGATDPFGRMTSVGWERSGLPTAMTTDSGRDYAALRGRVG